jgi:hypothetical protein
MHGDGRGAFAAFLLIKLVTLFVTAWIVQWMLRGRLTVWVREAIGDFWRYLGWGFIFLIVTPVAALLLLVTVIGIPLAVLTIAGYVFFMVMACISLSALIGSLVWKYSSKSRDYIVDWKTILIGSVVVVVLSVLPVIGFIIEFLLFLVMLGVIGRSGWLRLRRDR